MKNPTYLELMEYSDGRLSPARSREIEQMIAGSLRLQQELRLIRSMDTAVRNETPSAVPVRFTRRVLSAIQPSRHDQFLYRIARSSSALFAMAMVLSVIGIAVGPVPGTEHQSRSLFASAATSFRTVYDGAADQVSGWMPPSFHSVTHSIPLPSGNSLIIGLAVLFLFFLLDETVGKRYHRQTLER